MHATLKLNILQAPSIEYLKTAQVWIPNFESQKDLSKLGMEPPYRRTGFQIGLQKWTQPQTLESGICLTATVSSEWLRLKISKAGNMLNPTLKPYHFL